MASRSDGCPLSDDERRLIERFAGGDHDLRACAIDAYRRALLAGEKRSGPHMGFMAEVDNAVPDLLLRGQYRQVLAAQAR